MRNIYGDTRKGMGRLTALEEQEPLLLATETDIPSVAILS